MWSQFRALQKNKTVKYGVPMIVLVVGGSFGLREFTQIRYDAQKMRKKLDPALEARIDIQRQPVILEEEYEKMKMQNLDEWSNIRGPRPWENSREYQDQQRARQGRGPPGARGPEGEGEARTTAEAQPDSA